jgi:purine-cytosine permease-like protein
MRNFLVIILSFIVTVFGILLLDYYIINQEMGLDSFVLGFLGFMLVFGPAYDSWKSFFNKIL